MDTAATRENKTSFLEDEIGWHEPMVCVESQIEPYHRKNPSSFSVRVTKFTLSI